MDCVIKHYARGHRRMRCRFFRDAQGRFEAATCLPKKPRPRKLPGGRKRRRRRPVPDRWDVLAPWLD